MDERKFGRILETGMGIIMSFVLNLTAMIRLGAPTDVLSVLTGWTGALAVAIAINYLFPVMNWVAGWTKGIQNKTAEYCVRVFIFAFIEILFNSIWCMAVSGVLPHWTQHFLFLEMIGIPVIFISLPIMTRIAGALSKKK